MNKYLESLKKPKGLLVLGLVIVALIGIPLTVFLVQNQQVFQQFAHVPQPSVSTSCQAGTVKITYTYTITNVPTGVTVNVALTDSQNYVSDNFSWKNGDPPYTKTVDTQKQSIQAGVLIFTTSATDGFKATNQLGYPSTGPCVTPTPTITPSFTPTPSLTETPTPTFTPTPTITDTPTPTLVITDTPTPTLVITDTPTPTTGITGTPTITDTPTPTSGITGTPTITDTPTPTVIVNTGTPTPLPTVVVQGPTTTLPPTGPTTALVNLGIAGLVLLVVGGLLLLGL